MVDCHVHVKWLDHSIEDVVRHFDALGVEQGFALGCETLDPALTPGDHIPNVFGLEAARRFPDRFVPWCSLDPRDPRLEDRLQSYLALGCRGVGEQKQRLRPDNPDSLFLWALCERYGLPVLLHLDVPLPRGERLPSNRYWFNADLEALALVCEAFPTVTFIGHGPGFWREISGDQAHSPDPYPTGPVVPCGRLQAALDRCPNLLCDLSAGSGLTALRRDPGHAREFLCRYADRVLYGTDCFTSEHLDFLRSLELPAPTLDLICRANARRVLREA